MTQYNPKTFIVSKRYCYWSNIKKNLGETIQELAARIRHDATTCDFASITDAQDEALRTRFICSVGNEAILKELFKLKDEDLTFVRAIEAAMEMEEAAKVAKETVYGAANPVKVVNKTTTTSKPSTSADQQKCYQCGKSNHKSIECRYKKYTCNYCKLTGHLEIICRKKQKGAMPLNLVKAVKAVNANPQLHVNFELQGHAMTMEVDTRAGDNFISLDNWKKMGSPTLKTSEVHYESATKDNIDILGVCLVKTKLDSHQHEKQLHFVISKTPSLNLLGRNGIRQLGISVDGLIN
ncbi:uncharacterized protein [Watersipora subatra]|uniref:uncharacterized protein n=1 Tax=Watersipora subatra TaxID=2589382 RepID=UPI00355B0E66